MQHRAVLAALGEIQAAFNQGVKDRHVLPNLLPFPVTQECRVSQNYGDLMDYCHMFKQVPEFEPAGKYAFVSRVKFKLKWKHPPSHQVIIEKHKGDSSRNRVFSMFNSHCYSCYRNQMSDHFLTHPSLFSKQKMNLF